VPLPAAPSPRAWHDSLLSVAGTIFNKQSPARRSESGCRAAIRCDPSRRRRIANCANWCWMQSGGISPRRALLSMRRRRRRRSSTITVHLLQGAGEEEAAYALAAAAARAIPP